MEVERGKKQVRYKLVYASRPESGVRLELNVRRVRCTETGASRFDLQ